MAETTRTAATDAQLRRLARASLASQAEAVDTEADLAALHGRLAGATTPEPAQRRPASPQWFAAAAAVVLVLAGIVAIAWTRRSDTEPPAVAPPPPSSSPSPIAGTTSAVADPSSVRPGDTVTVVPAGQIQRACGEVVRAFAQASGTAIGYIVDGAWVPADDDASLATVPCEPELSDEPVAVAIPAATPAGDYVLCLTYPDEPEGCARVTVVPAEHATADPNVVLAGDQVTITPAGDIRRSCLDIVTIVDASGTLTGLLTDGAYQPAADGAVTYPDCESPPLSAEPVTFIVPWAIHSGEYSMCLAGADVPAGCALVTIDAVEIVDTTTPADTAVPTTPPAVPTVPALDPSPSAGSTPITVGFFGRRYTDEPPTFAIDRFAPNSATDSGVELSADALAAAFPHHTLPDGSTLELQGDPPAGGRCRDRSLAVRGPRVPGDGSTYLHPELPTVGSFGVTSSGVVVATRDVCPPGTRWGDPGTRHEVVALDTSSTAPPQILLTRDADPGGIQFDDGTVIALGDLLVDEVSPDGRYVALRDHFTTEASRWHVLDLTQPGEVLEIDSTCESAGDIVGPPRFVGSGVVVVARLCAAPGTGTVAPHLPRGDGEVQIEAIDLSTSDPAGRIVWHGTVPGLHADSYSRLVGLSARVADPPRGPGEFWVLVTGNGGVEQTSETFWLRGDKYGELAQGGYTSFAFHPADLIEPWEVPPS